MAAGPADPPPARGLGPYPKACAGVAMRLEDMVGREDPRPISDRPRDSMNGSRQLASRPIDPTIEEWRGIVSDRIEAIEIGYLESCFPQTFT